MRRVLARALGFADDLAQSANEKALWRLAEGLLPMRDINIYTQGLMDLGATVCTRSKPDCVRCPLQADCVAHHEGEPERYPLKTRKLKRGRRAHALLWLVRGSKLWLVQRPDRGVWASLWSMPEFESLQALREITGAWPGQGEDLPQIEHALTHFDWTLQLLRHTLPMRLGASRLEDIEQALGVGRWMRTEEALTIGLPTPIRRLLSAV